MNQSHNEISETAQAIQPVQAPTHRRRRADGELNHRAILEAAVSLATVRGLDGLSFSELTSHIGMSKGSIYAHFRSKEALQLATIAAAAEVVDAQVLQPAYSEPDGLSQLTTLCEKYLAYAQYTYPGGCFFASVDAEIDTHSGPVHDLLAQNYPAWEGHMVSFIEQAQEDGTIADHEEPAQLAFELDSLLHLANDAFVMLQDPVVMDRARRGIARRLAAAAPH